MVFNHITPLAVFMARLASKAALAASLEEAASTAAAAFMAVAEAVGSTGAVVVEAVMAAVAEAVAICRKNSVAAARQGIHYSSSSNYLLSFTNRELVDVKILR